MTIAAPGGHSNGTSWIDCIKKKGYISDPVGKAKSVVFTAEGLRESERLLVELFGEPNK